MSAFSQYVQAHYIAYKHIIQHIISEIYAVNTDGVFMTKPKYQYPNKKDVKFEVSNIGKTFQTDSPATYFEKHYRENLYLHNYTDQKGNGVIY